MKQYLTIHASMTPADQPLTFKDIDTRDRQRGWTRCGYHYVIERNGKVTPCRTYSQACLHDPSLTKCRETISVCLIGGTDRRGGPEDNFTDEQKDALVLLEAQVRKEFPQIMKKSATLALEI